MPHFPSPMPSRASSPTHSEDSLDSLEDATVGTRSMIETPSTPDEFLGLDRYDDPFAPEEEDEDIPDPGPCARFMARRAARYVPIATPRGGTVPWSLLSLPTGPKTPRTDQPPRPSCIPSQNPLPTWHVRGVPALKERSGRSCSFPRMLSFSRPSPRYGSSLSLSR